MINQPERLLGRPKDIREILNPKARPLVLAERGILLTARFTPNSDEEEAGLRHPFYSLNYAKALAEGTSNDQGGHNLRKVAQKLDPAPECVRFVEAVVANAEYEMTGGRFIARATVGALVGLSRRRASELQIRGATIRGSGYGARIFVPTMDLLQKIQFSHGAFSEPRAAIEFLENEPGETKS